MVANENLGPAERIIQSLLPYTDHCVHNRPGIVMPDPTSVVGVRWQYAKPKMEGEEGHKVKVLYALAKQGKKTTKTRLGVVQADGKTVLNGEVRVGEYRQPGFFKEVVTWLYKQVAEVWKLDNEFSARWASFAFGQEHRDLKVVLSAFMLVQPRSGEPVVENGKLAFFDDDFREVGEAMILMDKDKGGFNAKLLVRIRELLSLPEIAKINHDLGFGKSARRAELGRWNKAVTRWLRYREQNPKMLEGLIKSGARRSVISLACQVRYVPISSKFYQVLRWKQYQAKDGRRKLALNEQMAAAETWEGLNEQEVCERIVKDRPKWNRLSAMLPKGMGLTRAIMGAAIESGCISNPEMINLAPTIEELGLLQVQVYKERLDKALREAENMRAANIALRMKSKEAQEQLQKGADTALQKQVAEVIKGLFIYVIVDISGSMSKSIEMAMRYISQFVQGFPLDKLVVVVFNTSGRIVEIRHASKAGVENAFRGIAAGGGTDHGTGVRFATSCPRKPAPDEDVIMLFVGDGGERDVTRFVYAVRESNTNPVAFGFLEVPGENFKAVPNAAAQLGIPCFAIDERIFGQVATGGAADPYAIPRTIRALIAATPVGKTATQVAVPRVTLVDQILKTELLKKPAWASVPLPKAA
jgi:VWA domain containing CoxE-like protein